MSLILQCSLLYPFCYLGGTTNKPKCSFHVHYYVCVGQFLQNKHGEIQVFLSWRVHFDSEVTFIPYILTLYFILFYFFQASPEGLIIRRALWREKEDHCPYHLLPESGRVIGLCKVKWNPGWWLLIKNWLCHIKEELKVKMLITSLSQGPCTISFIQPWKVLSE